MFFVHMLKCLQPYVGESTLQGAKSVATLYYFPRVSMFKPQPQ